MFRRGAIVLITAFSLLVLLVPVSTRGQNNDSNSNDILRRAKTKVPPEYPELAHKMNITGTVKVEVVVAPNGMVKQARVLGGHPVLANAAVDAARRWRFEPAPAESTGVIEFKFEPK